jgi:hypothetical protein
MRNDKSLLFDDVAELINLPEIKERVQLICINTVGTGQPRHI